MSTRSPHLVRVGLVTAREVRRTPATDPTADVILGRREKGEHGEHKHRVHAAQLVAEGIARTALCFTGAHDSVQQFIHSGASPPNHTYHPCATIPQWTRYLQSLHCCVPPPERVGTSAKRRLGTMVWSFDPHYIKLKVR